MNPQIFGAGLQGRNRVVSSMRRLNVYYGWDQPGMPYQGSPAQGPDRAPWAIYDRAPLTQVAYFGAPRIRGMFRFSTRLYVVHSSTFYEVRPDYSFVARGTLSTSTGRVFMDAIEGLTGFEVGICDGNTIYIYNTTTLVFSAVATGFGSLTAGHSYFLASQLSSGKWNASTLGDGTSWPGGSFTTADADTDNLVAVRHYADVIHLFGEKSCEFWGFSGVGVVPWQRIAQNQVAYGLASPYSIAPFGPALIVLAQVASGEGGRGEVSVQKVQGGQFAKVSPPDLDFVLNSYPDVNQAEGCAWTQNGHLQYRLFFPSSLKTWMFDDATQLWSEESSFGGVSTAPVGFGPHRGVLASGFNNKVVFGDYADGSLWVADPRQASYRDKLTVVGGADQPIERELISRHIFGDGDPYMNIAALELDMNSGDGIPATPATAPQVMLSVSRDKGHTFSKERLCSAGAVGEYRKRVRWQNLGRARDNVVKIRGTDANRWVITGEVITPGLSQGFPPGGPKAALQRPGAA